MKKLVTTLVLSYIKFFAKIALFLNRPTLIGITGSGGKTSSRNAIYSILKDHKRTYMIRKGNSESGVPLGILGLHVESIGFNSMYRSLKDWARIAIQAPMSIFFLKKYAYLIIEMGIDDPHPPRNMSYLLSIVKPHIAVILNAFPAHAEQFETVVSPPITDEKISAAIAHEKCKMITENNQCRFVVYNRDNAAVRDELQDVALPHATFGSSDEDTLRHAGYSVTLNKTTFTYIYEGKKISLQIAHSALPDVFREIFASALLVGNHLGIDWETMIASLQKNYALEPGRNSVFEGAGNTTLIDSSYNGPSEGVRSMLALAVRLKETTKRPLAFIVGDMRELGSQSKEQHLSLIPLIDGHVDYLYTVGPLTHKYIYTHLKNNRGFKDIRSFESSHEVGQYLKKNVPKNAIILIKGSQSMFLEEAIKYLLHDVKDAQLLPRQEAYWLQKKQFLMGREHLNQ